MMQMVWSWKCGMRSLLGSLLCVTVLAAGAARGQSAELPAPPLDQLIQQFNAGAPRQDGVQIEAWPETGPEGPEIVVVVTPRGPTKLVADPGITVTPSARPGLTWRTPLPYRKVEPGIDYLEPPATLRLPFTSSDQEPVELLIEYAYCVVDFQCFFGEETLRVAIN
jgi:hypothetical protein